MVSIKEFNDDLCEITDEDEDDNNYLFNSNKILLDDEFNPSISMASSDKQSANQQEWVHDLLALSSLMSHHINSNDFISSESRLIHSKFQRLFHFLVTDVYTEPIKQALGDEISNLAEVDDGLIELNRNATLKFRNYKQFREQRLLSSNVSTNMRPTISNSNIGRYRMFRSTSSFRYFVHWLLHSSFFTWFISIIICLDVISVAITAEYSSPNDSKSVVYNIAVFINRCILFVYLFEIIFKWIENFINFWYSPANILEFILTIISLSNLISEIYFDTKNDNSIEINRKFHNNNPNTTDTLQRIKSYGSILSLLRTLRMLRVLRLLEIAFYFTQVRIVFFALSRSVKLIFHVVLLTIVLNYFFALIALYLTQFGLNTTSNEHRKKINALFGTVPRAFITVFRIFTKDEWFEIKTEMYSLQIKPFIIDLYVMIWLFFGGYVLNPLLIGAMVGTFDEARKELNSTLKRKVSNIDSSLDEINLLADSPSSLLTNINNDNDKFSQWLRTTSDEISLLVQDRIETQWPLYTAFYYVQLLEIYFENIAERQLIFDFISISLLALHDKETTSIDPPILSSSSSSSSCDDDN
ncbi:unnamed protein product [Rotaria magnacalcarata]|uniref:Ion transport domain-containing protein n=2 Tax=Rotaria magnacalcarata TaxID=392030 RepID=A0A816QGT2_9BILA|nr:unnamed protein product [Rotaria magnacalcarata]CAF2060953.1 unnamed protein product [Rotaria magnacalcarata]CAF3797334.1 unnamed protein product [Rotaria magnacalcarata]CAF3975279.1 unnamed protein product [Rotaria magnacalcarata]